MSRCPESESFPTNDCLADSADWDGDGDLNLTVSTCTGAVDLIENVGSVRKPKFDSRRGSRSVSVEQSSAAIRKRDRRLNGNRFSIDPRSTSCSGHH